MSDYDISCGDLNPTILYACKQKSETDGVYHSHDFTEMTYILSGQCRYLVEGQMYELSEGDILMCNKGVKHQHFVTNHSAPAVEFYAGFTDYHFRDMEPNCLELGDNTYIMHTSSELRQELNRSCFEMIAENDTCYRGRYFMLKAYLIQMMIRIVRENLSEEPPEQKGYIFKSNNKSYVVKRILSYLNENYNQKISLDQIAHNMYLSPVYISKIFKEETGESPINYLIKLRLEKARDIIRREQAGSIKDIANMVGYEDVYYFSKLFKKYYGLSPLHYRKKKTG